jgi:hypothetical protein
MESNVYFNYYFKNRDLKISTLDTWQRCQNDFFVVKRIASSTNGAGKTGYQVEDFWDLIYSSCLA